MSINELRIKTFDIGKSVVHASKTLKNVHVTRQMEQFQVTLSIKVEPEHCSEISNNIKLFKDGIEMTGKKLNKEFRENIIRYCIMSIKYYENLEESD